MTILESIVRNLQRSYPLPDKVFIPESDYEKLKTEMREYCNKNNAIGPLSTDIKFKNCLVMGVPVIPYENPR